VKYEAVVGGKPTTAQTLITHRSSLITTIAVQDSFVLTSLSQAEFYRHQPIDFFFYDESGNANLYILNDNVPGKAHNLIVVNEDERDLRLFGNTGAPGPDNYHFELRFRPGTIEERFHGWVTVGVGEWRVLAHLWHGHPDIPDATVSVYLLYHSEGELVLRGLSSKLIPLHGLKAGAGDGSRGAKAQLRYRIKNSTIVAADEPGSMVLFRQERLEVINQRGVRDIPLHAAFTTGNRVLNNGAEHNTLSLQITNRRRNDFIAFRGRFGAAPTRLVLAFDTSEAAETWALFDEDNALAVLVDIQNANTFWHVEKEVQGATPQWILSPASDVELDAGESFRIHLDNIISAMPAGMANLYLQYENIPGHWDDAFVVPIEKTPFSIQEKYDEKGNPERAFVGIGKNRLDTADEAALLQVAGGVSADFVELNGELKSDQLVFQDFLQGRSAGQTNISIKANDGSITIGATDSGQYKIKKKGNALSIEGESVETQGSLTASSFKVDNFEILVLQDAASNKFLQVKQNDVSMGGFIPRGGIIMWSGAANAVPPGWKLCDGNSGQPFEGLTIPDLRSRFVVGAGQGQGLSNYATGAKGGEETHTLIVGELPAHTHTLEIKADGAHVHGIGTRGFETNGATGADGSADDSGIFTQSAGMHSHPNSTIKSTGGDQAHENRPPYFALAFIIKL